MKTPFRLWRRPVPEAATALLLPTHDAAALAALCVRLGLDPLPPVFAVADGFLLKLPRPRAEPLGGVVRLRAWRTTCCCPWTPTWRRRCWPTRPLIL